MVFPSCKFQIPGLFKNLVNTVCVCCPNGVCRYDSSNTLAEGDVGMAGVAVDSVEDMKVHVCMYSHGQILYTPDTCQNFKTEQLVLLYTELMAACA